MKKFSIGHFFIITIIVAVWLIMEVLFYQIASEAESEYEKELIKQAKFYNQDMQNTRNWNLMLGGIYAHEDKVELNLYMDENAIETENGRLVRINPGWMTRMLSESFKQERLFYSIVSTNPINPQNQAIGFAKDALSKIEKNKTEDALYQIDKTNKRFEYVQPIYTKPNCMECHLERSYEIGSLRGAMLVDMDASFTLDRTEKLWQNFYFISLLATSFVALIIYFVLNISRQKLYYLKRNIKLEKTLKEKIQKLNQVLKASGLGYWEWNVKSDAFSVDAQWLNILGLTQDDVRGDFSDFSERIDAEDKKEIMPIIRSSIKNQVPYVVEYRMQHSNGHYVWIQGSGGVTAVDKSGKVESVSGTHQDITQRKLLELEQKNNTGYLNTLFEKNPNIIVVINDSKIIKANDAFFRFFDAYDSLESFSQEHKCISEFFESSQSDYFVTNESEKWVEDVLLSSEPVVKIIYKKMAYYFGVYGKKVYNNESVNIIITFNNITEIYGLKKRFEELSIRDELTKLYNRRCFNTVFKDEVNRAIRQKHSFCFAIIDIDNFKLYNDNYGHDRGDYVLERFAEAISALTKRSNEFFFRLGGEEFGLIFSGKTEEEALLYAQKICQATEALGIEHQANLPSKKITISIGVACIKAEEEFDLKRIYRQADEALYRAKAKGRNRVELFSS